jgi:7-cyano-7-deazaguanine synthase in queuosine biosynthesis
VQVVLAYSGGLDTSVILKWLQDTYDCEVVTFTADLGQVHWLMHPSVTLITQPGTHASGVEIRLSVTSMVYTN